MAQRTLNDAQPIEKLFDGIEQIEKEKLKDKAIVLRDFKTMTSPKDGKLFAVILVEYNKKLYTTTGGQVILERLQKLSPEILEEMKSEGLKATFKQAIAGKSKNTYWFIE
jgi:hypothetical protein